MRPFLERGSSIPVMVVEPTAIPGLLSELPSDVLAKLAEGAWPEPHCGVCRALMTAEVTALDGVSFTAAVLVHDYHSGPLSERPDLPAFKRGRLAYERCLEIYRLAGEVLSARSSCSMTQHEH